MQPCGSSPVGSPTSPSLGTLLTGTRTRGANRAHSREQWHDGKQAARGWARAGVKVTWAPSREPEQHTAGHTWPLRLGAQCRCQACKWFRGISGKELLSLAQFQNFLSTQSLGTCQWLPSPPGPSACRTHRSGVSQSCTTGGTAHGRSRHSTGWPCLSAALHTSAGTCCHVHLSLEPLPTTRGRGIRGAPLPSALLLTGAGPAKLQRRCPLCLLCRNTASPPNQPQARCGDRPCPGSLDTAHGACVH